MKIQILRGNFSVTIKLFNRLINILLNKRRVVKESYLSILFPNNKIPPPGWIKEVYLDTPGVELFGIQNTPGVGKSEGFSLPGGGVG